MKKILIADSSKASLVMTSEVFKDHYPGIQVLVAKNSAEALDLAKTAENIDAFIIDYDLPDLDGAKTALLLKKISKTPILITAFDKEEVIESIERILIKYEDCKSWLKKPVNPEVVIAVAQRYCDGKIRTQKRITCSLPALAQIEFTEKVKKTKTPLSKILKLKKTEPQQINSLCFYGIIEDCSLSGIKLKPSKNMENNGTEWSKLLENIENIPAGHEVVLKIPQFLDIEIGKSLELQKNTTKKTSKEITKEANKETKKTSAAKMKKSVFQKDENTQELLGKVIWTSSDTGEWCLGIELENQGLSKRLFEAVVSSHTRQHKLTQSQSIMKTARSL